MSREAAPQLPYGWRWAPIRYVTQCLDGRRVPLNSNERAQIQGEFPYWGANGVVDSVDQYIFDEPLVLLGEDGAPFFDKTKQVAFFVNEKIWVNNHIHVLRAEECIHPQYLANALNATDYTPWIQGSTRDKLTQESMGSIRIAFPSKESQRAIAAYLDRETKRLDELVGAKEGLLALIAEKRRALITCAVTKGLNPKAPLVNSEVPWLGPVPKHWKTRKLAYLFSERDEREQPELPLLEVSINRGVVVREFSDDKIESTAADLGTMKVARKGDIVFNKMRMWQGAVGVSPCDGLTSPDYVVATPTTGELHIEYVHALFRTGAFSAECARHSNGLVWDRLRLYWEGFRDIRIPLPPLAEQQAIVAHISKETAKLDALGTSAERTIALLKERRSTLISAAVTGRIAIP